MTSHDRPLFSINQAKQMGFVVHDCEKTAERLWKLFGIGPWEINVRDHRSTHDHEMIKNMIYRNKPGCFGYKMAEASLPGGMILEYIQPLYGENIYSDFLRERGEGMHHIGWHIVNNQEEFNTITSLLEGQGFPCMQTARLYASQMAYFDTTSVLNTILEVSFRDPTKKRPAPLYCIPRMNG